MTHIASGKQRGPATSAVELAATEEPVVDSEETEGGDPVRARLHWIAILVWMAAFLGLSITAWIELIIGVIRFLRS